MRYDPIAFEIHVRNFMIKKFKERLNLKNLETVIDDYVNTIENFFKRNRQKNKLLDSNFQQLLKSFNKKATATNFVNYLSSGIQTAFSTQVDYMERIKFLEEKALPAFGQDNAFSLTEVLSDETGLLKDKHCLDITITERLLNKGWFDLDWSKRYRKNPFFKQRNPQWLNVKPPFPPFTDNYKLFYGNLPLSWIKMDTERQKVVTVLQQEQGLHAIRGIYSDQVALLNTLIQTPDDFVIFLNQLAPSQYETALAWINSVPKFARKVLNYYSNDATKGDLLEPLLSFLSQLKAQNIIKEFATQLNLKGLLQLRLERLSTHVDTLEGSYTQLIGIVQT